MQLTELVYAKVYPTPFKILAMWMLFNLIDYAVFILMITNLNARPVHQQGNHIFNSFDTLMIDQEIRDYYYSHHKEDGLIYEIGEVEWVSTRIKRQANSKDLAHTLHLNLSNKSFTFLMHKDNELLSPHFRVIHKGTEQNLSQSNFRDCIYKGQIVDENEDGQAAFINCDKSTMSGVVQINSNRYIIHPLPKSVRAKRQASNKVIVIKPPHPESQRFCAVKSKPLDKIDDAIVKAKRETLHGPLTIETAVFADNSMFAWAGHQADTNAMQAIANFVLSLMAGVQMVFDDPSLGVRFKFVIVMVEIITDPQDPYYADGHINAYLQNFCTWENRKKYEMSRKGLNTWDHGIFLTGLELYMPQNNTQVLGMSWDKGMCRETLSCTINDGRSLNSVNVISHEIGHNLGMQHDGTNNSCSPDNFVMSPNAGPGRATWSSCSNEYLWHYLAGPNTECLQNQAQSDLQYDFSKMELPGQLFPLDEQCQAAFGDSFHPYITNDAPYEDVCRELWCANETHAQRSHAALIGTTCGILKVCIGGKCADSDEATTNTTSMADATTSTNINQMSSTAMQTTNLLPVSSLSSTTPSVTATSFLTMDTPSLATDFTTQPTTSMVPSTFITTDTKLNVPDSYSTSNSSLNEATLANTTSKIEETISMVTSSTANQMTTFTSPELVTQTENTFGTTTKVVTSTMPTTFGSSTTNFPSITSRISTTDTVISVPTRNYTGNAITADTNSSLTLYTLLPQLISPTEGSSNETPTSREVLTVSTVTQPSITQTITINNASITATPITTMLQTDEGTIPSTTMAQTIDEVTILSTTMAQTTDEVTIPSTLTSNYMLTSTSLSSPTMFTSTQPQTVTITSTTPSEWITTTIEKTYVSSMLPTATLHSTTENILPLTTMSSIHAEALSTNETIDSNVITASISSNPSIRPETSDQSSPNIISTADDLFGRLIDHLNNRDNKRIINGGNISGGAAGLEFNQKEDHLVVAINNNKMAPYWQQQHAHCSKLCGSGTRFAFYRCITSDGEASNKCNMALKPVEHSESCNTEPCGQPKWRVINTGQCNVSCGSGMRTLDIACIIPNESSAGEFDIVADAQCINLAKPDQLETCFGLCQSETTITMAKQS